MLAKRNPRTLQLFDLFNRENDLFSSLLEDFGHFHGLSPFREIKSADFSPSLDFAEKKDKYVATLEVPGIEKNGITIETSDDGTLIIKGEKKKEKKEETDEYYVDERYYGHFRREIRLPDNSETEKIDASYDNGVLKINIPKKEEKKKEVKKVEIK